MAAPISNTHIRAPLGFSCLLEGVVKEVLRYQPENINEFCFKYFTDLVKLREETKQDLVELCAQLEDRYYNNRCFKTHHKSEIAQREEILVQSFKDDQETKIKKEKELESVMTSNNKSKSYEPSFQSVVSATTNQDSSSQDMKDVAADIVDGTIELSKHQKDQETKIKKEKEPESVTTSNNKSKSYEPSFQSIQTNQDSNGQDMKDVAADIVDGTIELSKQAASPESDPHNEQDKPKVEIQEQNEELPSEIKQEQESAPEAEKEQVEETTSETREEQQIKEATHDPEQELQADETGEEQQQIEEATHEPEQELQADEIREEQQINEVTDEPEQELQADQASLETHQGEAANIQSELLQDVAANEEKPNEELSQLENNFITSSREISEDLAARINEESED